MTREEAKEILTYNWTRVDNPNYSESELDEAFFMAIEALSADAVQGEWLDGWEVIRELSETRCMYNCFDENDRPMYEAMTSAIDIVRQMIGGAE